MYSFKNSCSTEPERRLRQMRGATGKTPVCLIWILAVLLLVSAGIAYRIPAHHLKLLGEAPIALPVPLSDFPMQIGGWVGTELSIRATTREYMEENFADDFFSRRYVNSAAKLWADVYVVYCSTRPGGILGHRPRVCYPAYGWLHDGSETSQFTSQAGRQVACLIHRFHKPPPAHDQTVVLSFYILNGEITTNEGDFSGVFGRRPNLAGDPGRYVAQVQIGSRLESSVIKTAEGITDLVLDFLPDANGQVSASGYIKPRSGPGKPPSGD